MGLASLYEDVQDARGDRGPRFIRIPSPRPHSRRRAPMETRTVTSDEIRPIPSPRPHSRRRAPVETQDVPIVETRTVTSDEIRPIPSPRPHSDQRESGKKQNVFTGFFRWFFNFKDDSWKGRILGFVVIVLFLLVITVRRR